MADRALRGMRIGANSMESDEGVVLAARVETEYLCPRGHVISIPFSVEADIPAEWECSCGEMAVIRDGDAQTGEAEDDEAASRPGRTHWDMLLERRSEEELAQLLEEQLAVLRAGKLRQGVHYQRNL